MIPVRDSKDKSKKYWCTCACGAAFVCAENEMTNQQRRVCETPLENRYCDCHECHEQILGREIVE